MLTIRNAEIFDGTGSAGFLGSVVIDGDRLVDVGVNVIAQGTLIDASDAILVPGFIDMHSHSDVPLWIDGRALSKVTQGITTEVVGNCGMSAAPLYGPMVEELDKTFARYGRSLPFTTVARYLEGLEGQTTVNVATLVGHGTLRRGLLGEDDRPASPKELEGMAGAIGQAMAEGAYGLSTGLIYPPGCYADTEEIVTLAKAMQPFDGIYFTHMRSEGNLLIEAVEEALTIGRRAGVSVQISHHKAMGPANWGKTSATLLLIDHAIADGQDVWLDQYPYEASATALSALLPRWVMAGGHAAALERLEDPVNRQHIMQETEVMERQFGWDRTQVGSVSRPELKPIQGMSILDVSKLWKITPVEALIRILRENEMRVSMIRFGIGESDMKRVIKHPRTLIGTDGSAVAPDDPYGQSMPHPRTYGTFPRVLRRYVAEWGWLSFEEAIHRMTGLAARRMGFGDRGLIQPGAKADLVLLDPATIADQATFDTPQQLSKGILSVWVNGVMVLKDGMLSGHLPGQSVRRLT